MTAGSVITHIADIIAFGHAGFLGPTGKCFTFDHRAEGYARGEGVGTIVIKKLSSAVRDGDTIRAVIRGSGVNQDGRTPGITLPSAKAQEQLIRELYRSALLDPKDTKFVEAHGTGTAVGDPIEAEAISKAFASEHRTEPLYVGALKSGIGHLEGIAKKFLLNVTEYWPERKVPSTNTSHRWRGNRRNYQGDPHFGVWHHTSKC